MSQSPYVPRCHKVGHPSRKVAITNLNRAKKNHDRNARDRNSLHVYLCGKCGLWHCGSSFGEVVLARKGERRKMSEKATDYDPDGGLCT